MRTTRHPAATTATYNRNATNQVTATLMTRARFDANRVTKPASQNRRSKLYLTQCRNSAYPVVLAI
eukprot:4004660-Amphidinium_carterae.1